MGMRKRPVRDSEIKISGTQTLHATPRHATCLSDSNSPHSNLNAPSEIRTRVTAVP